VNHIYVKNIDKAEHYYLLAIQKGAKKLAQQNLACIYILKDDLEKAERYLLESVQLDPSQQTYTEISRFYLFQEKNYLQSLKYVDKFFNN
jgi:tetratricopeptide (TPR) repeat protein